MFLTVILIAGSYLLGSIPFALVIGKGLYGVDVRESGSGNIGTTNVFRVLGKKAGILVFMGDFAKGFLPVIIATRVVAPENAALVSVFVAGAAIAGHNWSIFLRGRGGKGVATGGGAIIALMPWIFLLVFVIFWLILLLDRRVSVASLSAAAGFSAATLVSGQPVAYMVFALAGTAVVFYAHRSNLQRIARGEENKVSLPWSRRGATDEEATASGEAVSEEPTADAPAPEGDEQFEWEEPVP